MDNFDPKDTKPIQDDSGQERVSPGQTQPHIIEFLDGLEDEPSSPNPKPGRLWLRRSISALLAIGLVIGLAILAGYQSGTVIRNDKAAINRAVEAVIQYERALDDMEAGRCDFARQRLESAIEYDPEFPGLVDLLAEAYICISSKGTPTPISTSTLTPTADVRNRDDIFADAQALLQAEDWNQLLEVLDTLRKNDPSYMPIKVDGMYYLALRSRGEQRILVEGQLEGGIFDFTRAEQFGPLDVQGEAYKLWAGLYLSGLSFWEVDWGQVVFYFDQVVVQAQVPNLWDGSYFAVDRLATAQVYYSAELIALGDFYLSVKGYCVAEGVYISANGYAPLSAAVLPTAEWASYLCDLYPEFTPKAEP